MGQKIPWLCQTARWYPYRSNLSTELATCRNMSINYIYYMAKLHGAYSQDCQTYLGSRDYRAPEVVRLGINRKKTSGDQGGYGKPADMWSLGAPLIRNLASPEGDFPLIFHWCSGGSFTFHLGISWNLWGSCGRSADAFHSNSKGVVVYVMLSGERAFESQSKVEVESLGYFSEPICLK